ncbi:hypothetical protein Shy_CDS0051 [Escherichia phage Shy]|uniref:Uncharacterized protein n=1 Tax=Escherichia phage Halfdan TaxID=2234092 RepID=A0A2Z5H486_9CAUD|nr:hypothetical protein P7I17_gp29 [Escherichia phage Halfdan]AXC34283.1 hypothetical protein [Escherichia phage Halfdan]WQZ00328.1 hypothetical protein Shy_CDS0051 [Escherichia phage Shy]
MKTKAEILATDFVMIASEASPTGQAFVMAIENGVASPNPVIAECAVAPGYYNLLAASRVMFGALNDQTVWLQKLLDMLDALGQPEESDLRKTLVSMQNAAMLAQQCATDGLNNVATTILRTGLK